MKELSIEEKAKAYDKAIERAKSLIGDTIIEESGQHIAEVIFPELKESEDERIRKAIHIYLDWLDGHKDYQPKGNYTIKDMIAWLEKQGKQKLSIRERYDKIKDSEWFKKTHEGMSVGEDYEITPEESLGIDSDTYNEIVNDCIFDENKPKFKVGDWVVYYRNDSSREVLQVYDIRDGRYYFTDNVHFSWSVKECDEKSRLWTIQDAMDGDVLAFKNDIGGIIICKSPTDYDTRSYCRLVNDNFINKEESGWDSTLLVPATNEQCDTLMKAMADAGYTFDFAKKELKKIEQKPAWSEEDEEMFDGIIADIQFSQKAHNHEVDQIVYEREIDWLKSLKDRVQLQNITITDEELVQAKKDAYNDALDKIEYHSGEPTFDDGWSAAIWYLKKRNAQPQNRWKPSDEQMRTLSDVVHKAKRKHDTSVGGYSVYMSLVRLYLDLKKLREE